MLAFCTAVLILAHRSFLHVLVLLKEVRRFWNSLCPEAVHMKAWNIEIRCHDFEMISVTFLAWRIMPVKSSYSAGVRW